MKASVRVLDVKICLGEICARICERCEEKVGKKRRQDSFDVIFNLNVSTMWCEVKKDFKWFSCCFSLECDVNKRKQIDTLNFLSDEFWNRT